MKEATIVIDRDELEEIMREHLAGMFPGLQIESILGLGYGEVTVRLRKPLALVEAAPPERPLYGRDADEAAPPEPELRDII